MNIIKIYECKSSLYKISYIINQDIAHINTIETDYKYPKALLLLLKDSINDLKSRNVKKIQQLIVKEDKQYLENTTWKILTEKDYILIESEIDEFLINISKSLGII